jgi:hypothetical protein
MAGVHVHRCACEVCRGPGARAFKQAHRRLNLVLAYADERQRRWVAALESLRLGYGGIRAVAQITGLDEKTIRRGRRELAAGASDAAPARVRRRGAGRPHVEKKIRAC